jgi:hypothetical protein
MNTVYVGLDLWSSAAAAAMLDVRLQRLYELVRGT